MALQPSGNKEIFFVETEHIYLSIKGGEGAFGVSSEATLEVSSTENIITSEFNNHMYFKEYKNYEVIIECKNNSKVEFYHENNTIRNKVTPTGRSGKVLSGIINFRGDIGYSDLYVLVNNREHIKVTVEVFPSKIDYKDDYKALLNDVNNEIYNLAYGFLSRTYLSAELSNKTSSTYSEFYSILNYVYKNLLKAIDIILYSPHHSLVKESRVCKYNALRNSSMETLKWLEKRPHVMKNINGTYIPTEALQVRKYLTYNTNENKFLKFILLSIIDKINKFILNYKKSYWAFDDEIINKLSLMKKEIAKRINTTFLKDINEKYNGASISLVFSMASGYREVYKYYLMLQKGLNINSNIFSISMKDLPLLYEYWCFIKINSLLRKKYKLISSDFIKINNEGIVVALRKGIGSTLVYENTVNGERFEVLYNSSTQSGTLNQKPDNILSINKDGITQGYQFIFDAKYKADYSEAYANRYGGVGPKEEDINTMHRYRDAIVYKAKDEGTYRNCVFGAFVLFPFKNEEKYKEHDFYKSIEEVNIGGIPFLPSSTKLMEEFLDVLINESSYSTFERYLEPIGREHYIKEDYYKNRNVLVGTLKNKEQLEINLENKFYHTKCTNVNLMEREVKYVAIAQSKKLFGEDAGVLYYGKVESIELIKRRYIKEIPSDSEEMYLRFNIEEWIKLTNKIEVQGYQVRKIMYTTEYLLKNASNVGDLCIKERNEFRKWLEFKRYE